MNRTRKLVLIAVGIVCVVGLAVAGVLFLRVQGDSIEQPSEVSELPDVPTETPAPLRFSGDEALAHVAAQVALGPRPTGSEASQELAAYILGTLDGYGWVTESRPFMYQGVQGQNLVARSGDTGDPVYLLGAHYDTRLRADQDPDHSEEPVMGANDGGSGVAVLLELARVLDIEAVNGEVWLVFFDAEDNGRLDGWQYIAGSRIFAGALEIVPEYVIVVDMVGDADQQLYFETNSDSILQAHLWTVADKLGYGEYFVPSPRYSMLDDHTSFLERGIRAVDIIDFDYPYWHTTQDTLDKVSAESLERVGRVLEVFLEAGGEYPGTP